MFRLVENTLAVQSECDWTNVRRVADVPAVLDLGGLQVNVAVAPSPLVANEYN